MLTVVTGGWVGFKLLIFLCVNLSLNTFFPKSSFTNTLNFYNRK